MAFDLGKRDSGDNQKAGPKSDERKVKFDLRKSAEAEVPVTVAGAEASVSGPALDTKSAAARVLQTEPSATPASSTSAAREASSPSGGSWKMVAGVIAIAIAVVGAGWFLVPSDESPKSRDNRTETASTAGAASATTTGMTAPSSQAGQPAQVAPRADGLGLPADTPRGGAAEKYASNAANATSATGRDMDTLEPASAAASRVDAVVAVGGSELSALDAATASGAGSLPPPAEATSNSSVPGEASASKDYNAASSSVNGDGTLAARASGSPERAVTAPTDRGARGGDSNGPSTSPAESPAPIPGGYSQLSSGEATSGDLRSGVNSEVAESGGTAALEEQGERVVAVFVKASADLSVVRSDKLDAIAAEAKVSGDVRILVEGYASSDGALEFNLDLSQRRAEAVRQYLVDRGVAGAIIDVRGMGVANPVGDNFTAEGRRINRRAELSVSR